MKLEANDVEHLVMIAVGWLSTFHETTDAEFVLKKLFARGDVPNEVQTSLLSSAVERLRQHLADDEATFLLRSCSKSRIQHEQLKRNIVLLAIEWLELHARNANAEYVWNQVLRHPSKFVNDEDWLKVARYALAWLTTRRITDLEVDFTVNSLLSRFDLLQRDNRESIT